MCRDDCLTVHVRRLCCSLIFATIASSTTLARRGLDNRLPVCQGALCRRRVAADRRAGSASGDHYHRFHCRLQRFEPSPERPGSDNLYGCFYNNFEVARVARFREPDVAAFTARVAASGMIYKKRWGDAPLR